jgi:hypothetical protein
MPPSTNVRNILLRALFEPDFHNLLLTDPGKALKEYSLSDKETEVLKNPGRELYQFLGPVAAEASALPVRFSQPPTTTTTTVIAVIVVVAITAFVTAVAGTIAQHPSLEMYGPLLSAIRSSSGAGRMDLVKTLINELTRES